MSGDEKSLNKIPETSTDKEAENVLLNHIASKSKTWVFALAICALFIGDIIWGRANHSEDIIFAIALIAIICVHVLARALLDLRKRISDIEGKISR